MMKGPTRLHPSAPSKSGLNRQSQIQCFTSVLHLQDAFVDINTVILPKSVERGARVLIDQMIERKLLGPGVEEVVLAVKAGLS